MKTDDTNDDSGVQFESKSNLVVEQDVKEKKEFWGTRQTFAFLGFLGFALVYAMRVNLSVAIVAMVTKDNITTSDNNTSAVDDMACALPEDGADNGDSTLLGEFDWNEKRQGLILGSFYYGYLVSNLPGGMLAERWGGRLVLGLSILFTGILTVLSPAAARISDDLFIVVRVLEGLTAGVSFPAMNSLIAKWVLPEERSKYTTFIYTGVQFGTVITMAATGFLCESDFLGGWPSAFYVFGFLAIVWSMFWFPLVRNTPAEHPRISKQELELLAPIALKQTKRTGGVPWKSVITSVPVWGTVAMHFGFTWGYYTLLTELPTYLDQIQHFSMSSNGLLSALPYAIMYVYAIIHGLVVDKLTITGKMSIVNVRKISMVIACYIPMVALVGMCFVGCDRVLAIVVLCIAVGACGAMNSGFMCSHMDLAPRYAGTLMGFTNTFATMPGFIAPYVAGAITNDNQTLGAWRNVFLISVGIYGITTTIYIFTIQADVQPWNYYCSGLRKNQVGTTGLPTSHFAHTHAGSENYEKDFLEKVNRTSGSISSSSDKDSITTIKKL